MWCLAITVGFSPFVLPFDSTEANFGGGFADLLEVLPCRCRGEVGARGAGVGVEPVGHFGLVLSGSVRVAEYVRDLAFFAVVWAWDGPWALLRGGAWDAEGVPEESVFVRDGAGGAGEVRSQ